MNPTKNDGQYTNLFAWIQRGSLRHAVANSVIISVVQYEEIIIQDLILAHLQSFYPVTPWASEAP